MITKELTHSILNQELEFPLIVRTNKDNSDWVVLSQGEDEFHLPKAVLHELIEALEDHTSIETDWR